MRQLEVSQLRNVRHAELSLEPGLNVLVGRNAQGKTTVLEALGLLARGRSFRTEAVRQVVRYGETVANVRGCAVDEAHESQLEVEVSQGSRRFKVAGQVVTSGRYYGRLEAALYSSQRLKVVYGTMRDRRQYFDRAVAGLWPAYRRVLRDYQRVLLQRGAALEQRRGEHGVWDEHLIDHGAELRQRRARYLARLQTALDRGYRPQGEHYGLGIEPSGLLIDREELRSQLAAEIEQAAGRERKAGRNLVGPHRDAIRLRIDGREAAESASSGQARSLLLALTLAALDVYREERGKSALALLDDLDSELDEPRLLTLCEDVVRHGQAVVTTAHPDWARRLGAKGRIFEVEGGRVRPA